MTGRHAVPAATLFDGVRLQHDRAAVIEAGRIVAVVPRGEVPATMPVAVLPEGAWLAPGFIDTQVNGGGDVLFNDAPTPGPLPPSLRRTGASGPQRCCRP
jgi:N-acetylglucosamine-6-phosphate deacetylase